MAPKDWDQVKDIFNDALQRDTGERDAFLDNACGTDIDLRVEVESLLIAFDGGKSFLETPVIGETSTKAGWRLSSDQIISHFKIISPIASGGMGEVYLAEDQKLNRRVALKVLPERLNADKDRMRRFQREAKAVSTLNHPNILTIFEFDEQDSMHIIASEFVKGETLRERLRRGNLKISECLDIGIQIASALQAAHAAGVIHRDIKPENIMIRGDGLVKVLDFGLAKLTERGESDGNANTQEQLFSHPGLIMGTAAYMSPEQARAVSVDERSDIFSLGVVLYETLAGKPPFSGDTIADVIAAMIRSDPPRIGSVVPTVPADLDAIIAKAMKKECRDRYDTTEEMLAAMKRLQKQIETDVEFNKTLSLDELSNADTQILRARTGSTDFQNTSNAPFSIAILPFRNLTHDATVNFYAFSLADAVITELLQLRSLRVSPSSVIAKYEDYKDDPVTIAKELRVETVLAASYLVSDGRIHVTTQLIGVSDGQVLWGGRIEATANDIIRIQDTITRRIIEGLQLNIGSEEAAVLAKRHSINPIAYEEYLRGGDCFLRYIHHTVANADIVQAIAHFERAVGLDSNFSVAFVALGKCHLNRIHKGLGVMQDVISARDALDKGISLDPGNLDARANRTYLDLIQGEKRRAHAQMDDLRKEAPQNSAVHFYSMILYRLSGDYENALHSIDQMLRLDPVALVAAHYNRSRILMYQQRYDEAMADLNDAARIEPQHPFVKFYTAVALFRTGETLSAKKILEELMITRPNVLFLPYLAICLSSLGEHESAREQITEDLKRVAKTDPDLSYWLASAYLMENETDHAFGWLEYSIKIGNENLPWLESNPIWGSVRNDPHFRAIMQQLRGELYEAHSNNRRTNQLLADIRATDRPMNFMTSEDLSERRPESSQTTRRGVIAVAGSLMLVIFAAFFFGNWYYSSQNTNQIKSIAVMPFVNESGNPDNEYLSDGMTDALINSLSQLPDLGVRARSSVFRYKGKDLDARTIGKELGVQAALHGRVVQRGDDLTLFLELVDAQTGNRIWGDQYVRKQKDLISLQNEIARDVAENLKVKLSGADQQKLAKNYAANPEAYQLYLRGLFQIRKFTPSEIHKGISYFEQAIAMDPNYAPAYYGISEAYGNLALSSEMRPTESLPKAKLMAQKALEIDGQLSDGYQSLGSVSFWYDWDWQTAENQFKRSVELNPNNARAYVMHAHVLSNTGRHEEALTQIQRARELEPLNLFVNSIEGQFLIHAGRTDEALARLLKTNELEPNFWMPHLFASSAYVEKGMYAEAVREARRAKELSPVQTTPATFECFALVKSGRRDEARALLSEMLKLTQERYVPAYHIALMYNALDEKEEAFAWLEKGLKERDPKMTFLMVEPKWNNLSTDPRFQEILRKVGFPL
jgi:TolB-like protein/Flp pilus assembly protein TadD